VFVSQLMEKMIIKYQALVRIEILHHYFLDEGNQAFGGSPDLPPGRKKKKLEAYNVHDWLEITPDVATRTRMHGANLLMKKTKTGFLIISAIKSVHMPKIQLEALTLNFLLLVTSQEMAARTALPTVTWKDGQAMLYVFGNEVSRNYRAPYPSLSLPPERYASTQTYQPGDIVKAGTQQFVAIAPTTGITPPSPPHWRETDGTLSYATRRNLRPKPPSAPDAAMAQLSITIKAGTNSFDLLTPLKAIHPNRVFQLHLEKH